MIVLDNMGLANVCEEQTIFSFLKLWNPCGGSFNAFGPMVVENDFANKFTMFLERNVLSLFLLQHTPLENVVERKNHHIMEVCGLQSTRREIDSYWGGIKSATTYYKLNELVSN